MTASLIVWFARGAAVLALAVLATRLLRRASASLRVTVLGTALAGVLVLPALAALIPAWHIAGFAARPAPLLDEPPRLPVAEPAVAAPAPSPLVAAAPAPAGHVPWAALAAALWLAGATALLARTAVGAWRARRIARGGTPAVHARAHGARAWRALGGRGAPPRIVASMQIEAPIVVGAFDPVVVVPAASIAWSAERWRVVLLHELAHVRRRDGLANLIAQLACAAHWIDPLAWLAARRLREDRELAADDAVLRDGARASTYAEHLIALAAGARHELGAAALAMADASRFEARVVALLDADRSRRPAGRARSLAVVAATAGIAALIACVSLGAAAPPPIRAPSAPVAASDPQLQAAAERELDAAIAAHHATGALAIVLDAKSGEVRALAARGNADPRAARTPGSTFKPFTFAAALEAGVATPTTQLDCERGVRRYGTHTLNDASPHGTLDLGGILAVSSNVCTAKLAEPLGDRLAEALRRYHVATLAHIDTRTLDGASIAAGEGVRVTALDLAAGYTAFADHGMYHFAGTTERVMSEQAANEVLALMERVVTDAEGTGHAAAIDGVRVAGKTGTSEHGAGRYYASFVGIVPADEPRYVVLVGVDGVTDSGGKIAAPVFAKLAAQALGR
ncbi:MAG TPA: penicillin-binding transpeptidase domain-containing protein [Kofleriaceae bacterium]|nr:penicillin-binding transpeptidase domain-containing protein [Kofleriaceae bacterium]